MHSHPASRLHSYLTMQQSVEGDQNTPQIVLTIATTSAFISVLVRVRQEVLEEGSYHSFMTILDDVNGNGICR